MIKITKDVTGGVEFDTVNIADLIKVSQEMFNRNEKHW